MQAMEQRSRGQWDWVEELSYLSLLTMEACVIHLWQTLVHDWTGYKGLPFWAICVGAWVSYLVSRALAHSTLTADRRQAIVAALLILSALVNIRLFVYPDQAVWDLGWIAELADHLFSFSRIPHELLTIVLTFVVWWRGIVSARQDSDTPTVWFHFRVSVVLVFAYLFLSIFGHRRDVTPVLVAFFFSGLVSIALARILELGGIRSSKLGSARWVGVLVGATLGSLGLSLLVTALFSQQTLRAIIGWFQPLWDLLGRIAWRLLAIVIYLAFPLFEWLQALFRRLLRESGMKFGSALISPMFSPQEATQEDALSRYLPFCRTIFVVIVVVGGLLVVVRLVRKLVVQQREGDDLERESLLSAAAVADDLRRGLQERLAQLRAFAAQFGGRHRRSIASIRKIYASMVDLATEAGYPRGVAETPYEYRSTLYVAFPGGDEAVDAITEAYVWTHYGKVPDTQAKMERIVRHWQELQDRVAPRMGP